MKQNENLPENKKYISNNFSFPNESAKEFVDLRNAPIVSQLTGILPQNITITDYKEYLLKKYQSS